MAKKKAASVSTAVGVPTDYPAFLESLKTRVQQAQTRAVLSVNRELIKLYWDIGRLIVERQEREGWGKGIVDRLAGDVQRAFPGLGWLFSGERVADACVLCGLPECFCNSIAACDRIEIRETI